MQKIRKIVLRRETIRTLAGVELAEAIGGQQTTGPLDVCPPPTGGYPSCTGCHSINATCDGTCGTCGTCDGCTIVTFGW